MEYPLGWQQYGSCIKDPEARDLLTSKKEAEQKQGIRRYCNDCPVKAECLGYGIVIKADTLVFGGLSVGQRNTLPQDKKNLAVTVLMQSYLEYPQQ